MVIVQENCSEVKSFGGRSGLMLFPEDRVGVGARVSELIVGDIFRPMSVMGRPGIYDVRLVDGCNSDPWSRITRIVESDDRRWLESRRWRGLFLASRHVERLVRIVCWSPCQNRNKGPHSLSGLLHPCISDRGTPATQEFIRVLAAVTMSESGRNPPSHTPEKFHSTGGPVDELAKKFRLTPRQYGELKLGLTNVAPIRPQVDGPIWGTFSPGPTWAGCEPEFGFSDPMYTPISEFGKSSSSDVEDGFEDYHYSHFCKAKPAMLPIAKDVNGTHRFEGNAIVRHLLDTYVGGLGGLYLKGFSTDDWGQFYQLIETSVGGYCELSLVSDESKEDAINRSVLLSTGSGPKTPEKKCPQRALREAYAKILEVQHSIWRIELRKEVKQICRRIEQHAELSSNDYAIRMDVVLPWRQPPKRTLVSAYRAMAAAAMTIARNTDRIEVAMFRAPIQQARLLLAIYGLPWGPKFGMMQIRALKRGDVFRYYPRDANAKRTGYGPFTADQNSESAGYWTTFYGSRVFMPSENVWFSSHGVSGQQSGYEWIGIDKFSPYAPARKTVWR